MFALLFVVFSSSVSAEDYDATNMKVNIYAYSNKLGSFGQVDLYNDSNQGDSNNLVDFSSYESIFAGTVDYKYRLTFVNTNNDPLFKAGKSAKLEVNNLFFGWLDAETADPSLANTDNFVPLEYSIIYNDGSTVWPDNNFTLTYNSRTNNYSILLQIPDDLMTKDVYKIALYTINEVSYTSAKNTYVTMWAGTYEGAIKMSLSQPSEEAGLLSGIISWVKTIAGDVSSGFANMVKGITELPQKLWDLISDGLKNLFVPDDEYMSGYSDKWDELLSQRFGAIYDVATIIRDFVGDIGVSDSTNTIYIPSVSLNSVGIPFSFGGYDVQVVPDGFSVLVEICKKILSIACTFMFINGLRKRYDEIMGVEQ